MGGGEGTRERGKEGARERGSKRERKSERAREGCGEDTRVAELSHPSESCVKILWPISQQCVQKAREMLQASCPLTCARCCNGSWLRSNHRDAWGHTAAILGMKTSSLSKIRALLDEPPPSARRKRSSAARNSWTRNHRTEVHFTDSGKYFLTLLLVPEVSYVGISFFLPSRNKCFRLKLGIWVI